MSSERYDRQSFLGKDSQRRIENCLVGIVGLGGGGSHIVMQLAHIGFSHFILCDNDVTEESNLNRNIGATTRDAENHTPKVQVSRRIITALHPKAEILTLQHRWQASCSQLKACDIVFGCVDSFSERNQLESFTRRYLIPYIDIGMDVHKSTDPAPTMAGQVILSLPGQPCMKCLGFITEEKLALEASRYGAAGGRPQVVWPNGVLASTAVGIAMDLLTGWTQQHGRTVFLSYYGNTGTIQPHVRLEYLTGVACTHYPPSEVGDPHFKAL